MFKFKKKSLIYVSVFVFLAVFTSALIPALKAPSLDLAKIPLQVFSFARKEALALIFFHRNFYQNRLLQKHIQLLGNKLNNHQELLLENARLKELLDLKQTSPYKLVAARVIAHSPDSWSSNIVIDKGRNKGLKRGMSVITYLGFIGRIIETSEFTSKIRLINDPNIGISCIVQRSRQEGLVSGTLGSNLIMKYLPEAADIVAGDIILTSGLSREAAKGLLVGEVISVGKEFSGLSLFAIVKPAVNLSSVEEVLVVTQ